MMASQQRPFCAPRAPESSAFLNLTQLPSSSISATSSPPSTTTAICPSLSSSSSSSFISLSPLPLHRHQHRRSMFKTATITATAISSTGSSSNNNNSNSNNNNNTPNDDDTALLRDLRDDGTPRQILALITLTRMGGTRAMTLLHDSGVLSSKFRKTRIAALDTLGKLSIPSSVSEIDMFVQTLETDPDHSIRAAAAGGLSETLLKKNGSSKIKSTNQNNNDDDIYKNACRALRHAAIKDDHFIVRYSAIVALGNVSDLAAVALLMPMVQHNQHTPALEIAAAIDALGEILSEHQVTTDCINAVKSRINDDEDLVRAAVARTLVRWKNIPGIKAVLHGMLRDEVRLGRTSFVHALLEQLLEKGEDSDT